MKTKIIQFVPILFALAVVGFRYFSLWCIFTTHICYGTTISHISLSITKPFYLFSLTFLPIAIVLVFVSRQIFNSWLKLAVWVIPLLFVFIATQPVVSSFLSTNRDDAARLAGQVFTVFSLVLIIYKYLATRRGNPVKV